MPADKSRNSIPDIESLPNSALLTRRQLSELTGFADITFKVWAKKGRGPRVTLIEKRPRYQVGDVKAWMSAA